MITNNTFSGIYPVVPTPLADAESIDLDGLAHLANYYVESGSHGLVILGSGGEYPFFTFEEKVKVVEVAVKAIKGRIPVIAGGGFYSRIEAEKFIKAAQAYGADGFLIALPTYYTLKFDDVFDFYLKLCKAADKPILYYHYPQITGLDFSKEQVSKLLSIDGIMGVKESSINIAEMKAHIDSVNKEGFSAFTGSSLILIDAYKAGCRGAICPLASIAPKLLIDCYNALENNSMDRAKKLQGKILDMLPLMNSFGLPASIQKNALKVISRLPFTTKSGTRSRHAVFKEALRQMGHPITAKVRSPLPQITDMQIKKTTRLLKKLKLL